MFALSITAQLFIVPLEKRAFCRPSYWVAETAQPWVPVVSVQDCITHMVWMMDGSLGTAKQEKNAGLE